MQVLEHEAQYLSLKGVECIFVWYSKELSVVINTVKHNYITSIITMRVLTTTCFGLDYYLWSHMKTLVYETKVDSRTALRDRIFAAAEHIRNNPNNIGSATQSLLMRAENCIAAGGGNFEQLL